MQDWDSYNILLLPTLIYVLENYNNPVAQRGRVLFILLSSFWALKDMQAFRNVKLWILRILTVTCLYTAAMLWLGVKNGQWYLNFLGSIPTTCKVRMQDLVVRHWYLDPSNRGVCLVCIFLFTERMHDYWCPCIAVYYRLLFLIPF